MGYLDNSFHTVLTKDCPGILLFQTLRLINILLILKLCIICRTRFFPLQMLLLKVHKHEIFFWLFLSKPKPYGPKGLSQEIFDNHIRFGRDIRLSAYSQHAMKLFPRILSVRWNSNVSVPCLLFSFPNLKGAQAWPSRGWVFYIKQTRMVRWLRDWQKKIYFIYNWGQ